MLLSSFRSQRSPNKHFSFPSSSQMLRKEGAMNKSSLISSRMNNLSGASTQGSLANKASTGESDSAGHASESINVRVFFDNKDSGPFLQKISQISHDNLLPIKNLQVSHNHASFTTVQIKMSLLDFLKRYREEEQSIPKEILFRYCSELTNGLQNLNEMFPDLGYLDPKSILIDQNDHIRIAGFGDYKFVYEKSEASLRFEPSQVNSVLASVSKRDSRFQGWNLGAIIAGLCTLKPRLMSNIKLFGENRQKVIREKLKHTDLLYGKDFLKLVFHLFDPDIPKSDAINQLKDALSLVSPSDNLSSHFINQKQETEEQPIEEVSDSGSSSLQSLEVSNVIIVPAENSNNGQNESKIQEPRSESSFSDVDSVPWYTSFLEAKPQIAHPQPLCESISRDEHQLLLDMIDLCSLEIEKSILGYKPKNLTENNLFLQAHHEAQYKTAQNEEARNLTPPRSKENENMSKKSPILNASRNHDKWSSWEEILREIVIEERKEEIREELIGERREEEIKEEVNVERRNEELILGSIKGELAFLNEVPMITIECSEDFHEENLDIKRLLQLVNNEEDFTRDNSINLVHEALLKQRRNLSIISHVQIRDTLRTVFKMMKNDQISLYELLNNPLLNPQATFPGLLMDRKEDCKESLVNCRLVEKGLNPSPIPSSSHSNEEISQDRDQENFVSQCLIGKEESNKKPPKMVEKKEEVK